MKVKRPKTYLILVW